MTTDRVFKHRFAPIQATEFNAGIARLQQEDPAGQGIGVYVHLPFCPTRCLSCDRVALVRRNPSDVDDYLTLLAQELANTTQQLGVGVPIKQLLVGGGSPNFLSEAQLARLMDIIERNFTFAVGAELAIELNPKRSSRSQMELLAGLGFTSLRMEVRDIDPSRNFPLGRSSTPELLQDVFANARGSGFKQIHLDYVYGLPGQSKASIAQAARFIAELAPERVLFHPFTRREQAFPHQQLIVSETMPSTAEKMALFKTMTTTLESSGFSWVGINGFVQQNDPLLQAQANDQLYRGWLGYSDERPPWLLGFGLGAMSELPGLVVQNSARMGEWSTRVEAQGTAVHFGAALSELDMQEQDLVAQLGANLRTPFGAPDRHAGSLLDELISDGVVSREGETVKVTPLGRYELNERWEEAFSRQKPVNWLG